MSAAYCVGCSRKLPCSKKVHTDVERERLRVAAERQRSTREKRDFERRMRAFR